MRSAKLKNKKIKKSKNKMIYQPYYLTGHLNHTVIADLNSTTNVVLYW